jgi:hypothetical protein
MVGEGGGRLEGSASRRGDRRSGVGQSDLAGAGWVTVRRWEGTECGAQMCCLKKCVWHRKRVTKDDVCVAHDECVCDRDRAD